MMNLCPPIVPLPMCALTLGVAPSIIASASSALKPELNLLPPFPKNAPVDPTPVTPLLAAATDKLLIIEACCCNNAFSVLIACIIACSFCACVAVVLDINFLKLESLCNRPTMPLSIFFILSACVPIVNKLFKPSAANLATSLNIFINAAVKIATAGPPKNDPIALNKPLIKTLPFSGSNALSKNSENFVAMPTKFSTNGPKVIVPIFSARLVKP